MTGRGDARSKALLELLDNTLSEDEVRQALAGSLIAADQAVRQRLLEGLEPPTRQALASVFSSLDRGFEIARPKPGLAKTMADWERAWGDWDECVSASGSEDGRYVYQEHHWEAPDFDASSFFSDLDKVAARIRGLIPRVSGEGLEFDFAGVLSGTVEEMGSGLPEWICTDRESRSFGSEVTAAFLEWEWHQARRGQPASHRLAAFRALESARQLESSSRQLELDGEALVAFVKARDTDEQQAALDGMSGKRGEAPWAEALGNAHSPWFHLHTELAKRFSPALAVETCRAHIDQDWRLALPVMAQLLKVRSFHEALAVADQAVRGLLRVEKGEKLDPTRELIIARSGVLHRYETGKDRVQTLLERWLRAARGASQPQLAWALSVQVSLLSCWQDFDRVREAFETEQGAAPPDVSERLFGCWKKLVIQETRPPCSWSIQTESRETNQWLGALLDALRAKSDGGAAFRDQLRDWLELNGRTASQFTKARPWFDLLTLDIGQEGRLECTSPALNKALRPYSNQDAPLDHSRRRWLGRLRAADLFDDLMALWKRWVASQVPDPGKAAGPRYEENVVWLEATRDLDPGAFARILRDWEVVHKRRRNLWAAIHKRSLAWGSRG